MKPRSVCSSPTNKVIYEVEPPLLYLIEEIPEIDRSYTRRPLFLTSSESLYFLNDPMHLFNTIFILPNSALLFLLVLILFLVSGEGTENHLLK